MDQVNRFTGIACPAINGNFVPGRNIIQRQISSAVASRTIGVINPVGAIPVVITDLLIAPGTIGIHT
ncbi:hypothetical protein D3C75_1318580 [compost metagenome]